MTELTFPGLSPVSFPTLGWVAIDWMETFLCHGPGDIQGDDLVIDDEMALFILWTYRLHPKGSPKAGRRAVQRAILSRPKGRAKSEIAGAIKCFDAFGPSRFDGWDANGDPVGRTIKYPFIRCMATEDEQAGNTFDNITYMLTEGEAANTFKFDIGRSVETSTRVIIREPGGGEIRQSTAGDASKDGGKESSACADETHLYVIRKLRGMYRTVARNTTKRRKTEPWMLDTTTMFQEGENSIAEQAFQKYAELDVETAVMKHGVLLDHRQGDVPKRFGDDRSLKKAIKPGYGAAAGWVDLDAMIKVIRDAEDPEEEAYRYYLNRQRKHSSHWLSPGEITTETFGLEPGQKITVGFDGSLDDDHTALWACSEDSKLVPIGIWARPEKLDPNTDWMVPRDQVDAAVEWLFENFHVLRFYCDPPWWREEIGRWADRYADPERTGTLPIMEWYTSRDAPMAAATGALRTAIRQGDATINPEPIRTEQELRSGKPIAIWHFENARIRKVRLKLDDKTEEAYIVTKDRPGSALKIDSVPAAILARKGRDDAMLEGEWSEIESVPMMAFGR